MAIIREGKVLYFVMHDIEELKKNNLLKGGYFPLRKIRGEEVHLHPLSARF